MSMIHESFNNIEPAVPCSISFQIPWIYKWALIKQKCDFKKSRWPSHVSMNVSVALAEIVSCLKRKGMHQHWQHCIRKVWKNWRPVSEWVGLYQPQINLLQPYNESVQLVLQCWPKIHVMPWIKYWSKPIFYKLKLACYWIEEKGWYGLIAQLMKCELHGKESIYIKMSSVAILHISQVWHNIF